MPNIWFQARIQLTNHLQTGQDRHNNLKDCEVLVTVCYGSPQETHSTVLRLRMLSLLNEFSPGNKDVMATTVEIKSKLFANE